MSKSFNFDDPKLEHELREIWTRLQKNIGSAEIDTRSVSSSVAKDIKDGELEVLNRVLDGRTQAKRLSAYRTSDGYALYVAKVHPGSSFPAAAFFADSMFVEAVRVEQLGPGACLVLDGGDRDSEPVLKIERGTGSADVILDEESGANLSAGGTWANGSSREKKNLLYQADPLDAAGMVNSIPVHLWRYKAEPNGPLHLGPVAEDFKEVTGLGDSATIAASDLAGLALAAVKHLMGEIAELQERVMELEST